MVSPIVIALAIAVCLAIVISFFAPGPDKAYVHTSGASQGPLFFQEDRFRLFSPHLSSSNPPNL